MARDTTDNKQKWRWDEPQIKLKYDVKIRLKVQGV